MSEEEWERELEKYEKLYKLHLEERKKEIPNLMKLLENFDNEIYEVTDIYELNREIQKKIEKALKFNKNQERLFQYWQVCEDNVSIDMVEYAFVYGYSLAMGIKEECNKINRN